jgi:hypothetical protein
MLLLRLVRAAAMNYFNGESGRFYGKQQQYSLFLLRVMERSFRLITQLSYFNIIYILFLGFTIVFA